MVFPGKLYITSRHLCFASPADKVTAVVPLAEVAKASVAGALASRLLAYKPCCEHSSTEHTCLQASTWQSP